MIRVAIVIPGLAVRAGLRALLEAEAEIEVVADAPSLNILRGIPAEWDVLLASGDDLQLEPTANSLNPVEETGLLVLTDQPDIIAAGLKIPYRGWGFLPAEASIEEIAVAIRAVDEGLLVAARDLLQPALETRLSDTSVSTDLAENLTDREQQVLQLLARGLSNKQIAAGLSISQHTVKFHISSIFGKLGAGSRTEAVRLGVRHGLVSL